MSLFFRNGQVHFEYLALTGIFLAILIPLIYASLSTASNHYRTTQVDSFTTLLADKVDEVYKLGAGNKNSLYVTIPSGITGASIAGNAIAIEAQFGADTTVNFSKTTEAHVIGNVPLIQGEYLIPVKALNASLVRIGSGPLLLSLEPSCIGAPNFANPPNITLFGDDFTLTSVLQKDNVSFNQAYYQIIDSNYITFVAHPTEFVTRPIGPPYTISVVDKGIVSNMLEFLVYPNANQCP